MAVTNQAILGGSTRIGAVAPVIHQQHGESLGLQCFSQSEAVVPVGCVPPGRPGPPAHDPQPSDHRSGLHLLVVPVRYPENKSSNVAAPKTSRPPPPREL